VHHRYDDRARQISEEIRFASPASDRFTYLGGLYYFGQTLNSSHPVTLGSDFPVQGILTTSYKRRRLPLPDLATRPTTSPIVSRSMSAFAIPGNTRSWTSCKPPVLALGYPAFDTQDHLTETDFFPRRQFELSVFARGNRVRKDCARIQVGRLESRHHDHGKYFVRPGERHQL